MYACTFFGHRDAGKEAEPILRSTLIDLIENRQTTLFYVGNQGGFDSMVENALQALIKQNYEIRRYTVLAYLPQGRRAGDAGADTLYPEGLESVPKQYAISWRNQWMIGHADVVITYVKRPYGGAAQFKEIALRSGKEVIELADRME
ncbi:MAG: hypothetical protein IK118_08605 [Clostridia bacterium]|nr:hypothetical protein [Clostridia bacterium]MBR5620297.1 hypothetical protein [Clostridia bacterium]